MTAREEIVNEDAERAVMRLDASPLRGARVLLAGANGLLGSSFAHFFNHLNRSQGFGISCDCVTKNELSPESRIYDLREASGFRIIQANLATDTPYDGAYDFVIYAAGYSAPLRFLRDPLEVVEVNYDGMKRLLRHVREKSQRAKVLYFSSSEIYGSPPPESIPTPETYPGNSPVTNPRACYVESKRLTEVMCLIYRSQGIDVKIVRPALTYGPGLGLQDERVLSQFVRKAHLDKKIDMLDDGRDLRAYCYGEDMLVELLLILLKGKEVIYNAGSDREEVSIKDLALTIGSIMGVPVNVGAPRQGAVGAPGRGLLDISKVRNEFGFAPKVTLEEGLRRTIQWATSNSENQNNE